MSGHDRLHYDYERLEHFFICYGHALAAGDLPGIARCYSVPGLVLGPDATVLISDRAQVEQAFGGQVRAHREQGLYSAHPKVVRVDRLNPGILSVDVRWDYLDADGIAQQHDGYRYALRVDAHGEPLIQVVVPCPALAH